jgi:hypothetical protein
VYRLLPETAEPVAPRLDPMQQAAIDHPGARRSPHPPNRLLSG